MKEQFGDDFDDELELQDIADISKSVQPEKKKTSIKDLVQIRCYLKQMPSLDMNAIQKDKPKMDQSPLTIKAQRTAS